jgi:hypothetical protein
LNEYKEHNEEEQEALAAEALKKVMAADGKQEAAAGGSTKSRKKTASASDESTAKKDKLFSGRTFVQIMNGEILTRDLILNNLPFTFYIGFLFVVMIAWGYYGETVAKKEIQLEKQLGELNSEFFTLTADYNMQRGRRQVASRLEPFGIKESVISPNKIRVRKYIFH